MRRFAPFFLLLILLACLSGFLMSKPSLIGKIGIDLFYRQYKFLRTWWQGALAVFGAWMVLLLLQALIQYRAPRRVATLIHLLMIGLALVGFYFTYRDFHDSLSHRMLKSQFHIGAYLFWAGWIMISLFYLLAPKPALRK